MAKGLLQQPRVDFGEVFASVARVETIRMVVAYASLQKWGMWHMVVKLAFLNGTLDEDVL